MFTSRLARCMALSAGLLVIVSLSGCPSGRLPARSVVPDLTGMSQAEAEASIAAAGLSLGTETEVFSDTVAVGLVLHQAPAAGAEVDQGSTVDLVISLGPADVPTVLVPNVAGLNQTEAEAALVAAGLVPGSVTEAFSDTVAVGLVLHQAPAAGAEVDQGSTVDLVISLGPADVPTVLVPNVTGLNQTEAEAALVAAGLVLGAVTEEFSDTIVAGLVLRQSPAAGLEVAEGSAIQVVVSKGPEPPATVAVPNLTGLNRTEAEAALVAVGLVLGSVTEAFSNSVAAGLVIGHNPGAGNEVEEGSAVNLVLSKGPQPSATVLVPDVTGLNRIEAMASLAAADLVLGNVTEVFSDSVAAGLVILQHPAAGVEVARGSTVNLVLSKGPQPDTTVLVPALTGLNRTEAEAALVAVGLVLRNVTEAFSDSVEGLVIGHSPGAGTEVRAGAAIDIVVSLGPEIRTTIVPDVVGIHFDVARTLIADALLQLGTIASIYHEVVPLEYVTSQDPPAQLEVEEGSQVSLVVSKGFETRAVPEVVGERFDVAQTLIEGALLQLGTVESMYHNVIWPNHVIQQYPEGGTQLRLNSPVDLDVSMGQPAVPNVQYIPIEDAERMIQAVGLVVGPYVPEIMGTVPAGYVASQSLPPGTHVILSTVVNLTVSLGEQFGEIDAVHDWSVEGNFEDAHMGQSVASAGDIDSDGYDDVLIGSHYRDGDAGKLQGRVDLFLGSPAGLSASADWSAVGRVAYEQFGYSLSAAGDVNGDGYGDVIIGSLEIGDQDFGRAYVFHGSASGLSPSPDWVVSGTTSFERFGRSVAGAGDVNGDGYDDIVISAAHRPVRGYYGSETGVSAEPDWTASEEGYVAGAGDINGDGFGDVIVADRNDGRAFLYLGSPRGLYQQPAWEFPRRMDTPGSGLRASCAGDTNGDGYDDIIVCIQNRYLVPQAEVVHLFLGGSRGLSALADWTFMRIQDDRIGDDLRVAGIGDTNGDGFDDVLIGDRGYWSGGVRIGRADVFLGSPSGLLDTAHRIIFGEQNPDGFGDLFGEAVAEGGDVNGDGLDDFIVGAPYFDNPEQTEGHAYVYHGHEGK